ncbi:MAG: hypothetical protein GWN99_13345 [Gemmatimonadetes bacterium]|uniref:Lipoprotein n=1 Tax=Candidatus Kutchimonas denitrificans TaxID=3056748 RepID=A0AAE4ZD40_9BACT|nr:hypothetical protein [Gemmatimonadota bacterium]NIR75865.1 hypothetical protein [Candidatus Kutchimonas denitrificans]NIS02032.1 hypothetical protein [Gemmatimonadota bacterium]NIT67836.1 hypothetical protein [Gemmatimonadota bacterium]NIU53822.1 hypothetical protein [Gemmatimonadota bacterium]
MRKKVIAVQFISISCVLLMACSGPRAADQREQDDATAAETGANQDETRPRIRLANLSSVDFDSVVVTFPEQVERYGRVPQGGVSEYRGVSQAYRYAHVEAFAGDETYLLEPIDYVGETLLAPGRYTYQLRIRDGHLSLTLQVD